MSPQQTLRGIWRWYWALLVANALDLRGRAARPAGDQPRAAAHPLHAVADRAEVLRSGNPGGGPAVRDADRPPPGPRPAHGARGRRRLPRRPALPPPRPGLRLANPAPRRRAASRHDGADPLNPRES